MIDRRYAPTVRPIHKLLMWLVGMMLSTAAADAQDFTKGQTFSTGPEPYGIKTADLNKDGKLDLIIIVNRYFLEVHLGNGNGTFSTPGVQYDSAIRWSTNEIGRITEFEVVDVNNDGNPDLVAVGGRHLAVLKGNGMAAFNPHNCSRAPIPAYR